LLAFDLGNQFKWGESMNRTFTAIAFALCIGNMSSADAASKQNQYVPSCFDGDQDQKAFKLVRRPMIQRRIPTDTRALRYARDLACTDIDTIMSLIKEQMDKNGGDYNADDIVIQYVHLLSQRAALYNAATVERAWLNHKAMAAKKRKQPASIDDLFDRIISGQTILVKARQR